MKVVITSATEKEIIVVKQTINPDYIQKNPAFTVLFHESGVGILASCFSISTLIFTQKPDLIIQAGIAGTFDKEVSLGKVLAIKEEITADAGVEEYEQFNDLFDLNLQNENLFPYHNKRLINPNIQQLNYLNLDEKIGITVNEITTRPERIEQYKTKYNPFSESMEGASLHYCCLQNNIPFIQIRAVSNYVGERDKRKWEFKSSLQNLADVILRYIEEVNKVNNKIVRE